MPNWITKTDIKSRIPNFSPNNTAADILNQIIYEAQQFDLEPFLGNPFYYELDQNVNADASPVYSAEKYDLLFEGDTYTDGDFTIKFEGLKQAVIYFAFARFLEDTNIFYTRGGAKFKTTDQSTPAGGGDVSTYTNNYRSKGVKLLNAAYEYLCKKKDTFPNWYNYACKDGQKQGVKMFTSAKNDSNLIYPRRFASKNYRGRKW